MNVILFFVLILEINVFSPGDLSIHHTKFEGTSNCALCHSPQSTKPINESCLSCHKSIEQQLLNKKGYHYKTAEANKNNCVKCHIEHRGKNNKIIIFDEDKFDHSTVGYKLTGKHKEISCYSCHNENYIQKDKLLFDKNINLKRTYQGLPTKCIDCHENDYHKEQLVTENCQECHNTTSFKDVEREFNHDDTKYPLEGKHKNVECSKCHKPVNNINLSGKLERQLQYKKLKFDKCSNCHSDTQHEGFFTNNCERCHTVDGFDKIIFDKSTHASKRFELKDGHSKVDCKKCHGEKTNLMPKDKSCVSCHKDDDVHKGKFSDKCEDCHNIKSFKSVDLKKFNHNLTGYVLEGKHQSIKCEECHKRKDNYNLTYVIGKKSCVQCHKDVHYNQFGENSNCASCHDQKTFKPSNFTIKDHNKLNFKLENKHKAAPCFKCHKEIIDKNNNKFVLYKIPEFKCQNCHKDRHNGQFNKYIEKDGCESCHNTTSFKNYKFDHNTQTNFVLRNKHAQLNCVDCHKYKTNEYQKQYLDYQNEKGKDCSHCHTDIHLGQFGDKKCSSCHQDNSFKDLTLFDHNKTGFQLTGKHSQLGCSNCHKKINYKNLNITNYRIPNHKCIDCHDSYH